MRASRLPRSLAAAREKSSLRAAAPRRTTSRFSEPREPRDALARVMRPDAELRFASDDPGYFSWALERLCAHPWFAWTATGPRDWKTRPPDWPQTRYEAKALHGPPRYLRFVRSAVTG